MKRTILILLLLMPYMALADDACKLYLCLMGASETDGGLSCKETISAYTGKFKGSCPNLPTCVGTAGPGTYGVMGVLMTSISGNGGSTAGPENGVITQVCAQVKNVCTITLTAPAFGKVSVTGVNSATCGG